MSGKAPPRRSGRKSAQTSRAGKDQSRLTSAATFKEDAPPYTVAAGCDRRAGEERRSQSAATGLAQGTALRFIDLFCGIGGFRLAFERADAHCVFSSDWDRFSRQTYGANFGEEPAGDINKVDVKDIPAHDILCGGFPCQPFSLAGVSNKNSLTRSNNWNSAAKQVIRC